MEQYKKTLKLQNILFLLGFFALVIIQILAYCGVITPVETSAHWANFWNGFIAGASAGVCILLLIGLFTNIRALQNEEKLKKLYIKEHDERKIQINKNGKSAGATIFMILAIPAAIIAGYFNIKVFITIILCDVILSLTIFGAKLYYNREL